jgi:hypothetical protein
MVVKSLLKIACVSIFVLAAVAWGAAQSTTTTTTTTAASFPTFNPPPCDYNNQFYSDNGIDSSSTSELNAEADGRFGSFRQTGPPAKGNQVNWVADSNCDVLDPDRRNFRILATTGGNSDDGNTPFTCGPNGPTDAPNPSVGNITSPPAQCAFFAGEETETVEFINIIAFLHNAEVFLGAAGAATDASCPNAANGEVYCRVVGFINGGLDGVQQNPGETISITSGTDANGNATGLNPRGISMNYIVGNFEAYAEIDQIKTAINCNATALANGGPFTAQTTGCKPAAAGQVALNPCSADMINQFFGTTITDAQIPQPCFTVADTTNNSGVTLSDVATPNLQQNWRFGTNRNAIDGTDNNCINVTNCGSVLGDSPFGYFCDDLLGMWVITYQWFTQPPTGNGTDNGLCASNYALIAKANGTTLDGYPIILSSNELDGPLMEGNVEANGTADPCMGEAREDGGASESTVGEFPAENDGGAAWLVCPAIPDPRNGGISSDAFLDTVTTSGGAQVDAPGNPISTQFKCLQTTGKFCFESAPGQ